MKNSSRNFSNSSLKKQPLASIKSVDKIKTSGSKKSLGSNGSVEGNIVKTSSPTMDNETEDPIFDSPKASSKQKLNRSGSNLKEEMTRLGTQGQSLAPIAIDEEFHNGDNGEVKLDLLESDILARQQTADSKRPIVGEIESVRQEGRNSQASLSSSVDGPSPEICELEDGWFVF
jgi:hypothetical protein